MSELVLWPLLPPQPAQGPGNCRASRGRGRAPLCPVYKRCGLMCCHGQHVANVQCSGCYSTDDWSFHKKPDGWLSGASKLLSAQHGPYCISIFLTSCSRFLEDGHGLQEVLRIPERSADRLEFAGAWESPCRCPVCVRASSHQPFHTVKQQPKI